MPRVKLIQAPTEQELIPVVAAARCYSDLGNDELLMKRTLQTPEGRAKFIQGVMKTGHLSTIEHVCFTFMIEDVSRAFLAQITRHRLASFSVQSQRYVRIDTEGPDWYCEPEMIANFPEIRAIYEEQMRSAADAYNRICERLVTFGRTEEQAQEDARFVLPEGTATKMVVTMNARELLHFFSLRCCNRAQWEIRDVAWQMLGEVKKACPALFANAGPSCLTTGKCPEGKRSCGHPYRREDTTE